MELSFAAPTLQGGDPSKCRVILPCRAKKYDAADLRRFGHKIVMATNRHAVYPDDPAPASIVEDCHQELQVIGFDPARDYIALAGDGLLNAILCMVLGRYYQNVVFLRFDGQAGSYWPLMVQ